MKITYITIRKNVFRIKLPFSGSVQFDAQLWHLRWEPSWSQFTDTMMMRETTTRGQNLITSQLFQMFKGSKWVTNTIPLECKIEVHTTANVICLGDPIRHHVVFDTSSWKVTKISTDFLIRYKTKPPSPSASPLPSKQRWRFLMTPNILARPNKQSLVLTIKILALHILKPISH